MKLLKLIFMSNVLIICSLGLLYYPLAVAPFCGLSFLRPRGLCGAHLGVACWSLHICRCTPLQSLAHTRARPFSYRFSPASPTLLVVCTLCVVCVCVCVLCVYLVENLSYLYSQMPKLVYLLQISTINTVCLRISPASSDRHAVAARVRTWSAPCPGPGASDAPRRPVNGRRSAANAFPWVQGIGSSCSQRRRLRRRRRSLRRRGRYRRGRRPRRNLQRRGILLQRRNLQRRNLQRRGLPGRGLRCCTLGTLQRGLQSSANRGAPMCQTRKGHREGCRGGGERVFAWGGL